MRRLTAAGGGGPLQGDGGVTDANLMIVMVLLALLVLLGGMVEASQSLAFCHKPVPPPHSLLHLY